MLRLIILFVALLWALPVQAATFFDEGFEYTNSQALIDSPWTSFPCTAAQLDTVMGISSDRAHSGTKSLKYIYIGPNPTLTCWMDRFYPARTEIWTREWIFLDGFTGAASVGTKHQFHGGNVDTDTNPDPLINSGDGGYPNLWSLIMNAVNTIGYSWQGGGGNTSTFVGGGTLPSGQWVCIEEHLKMNTVGVADGINEIYVNGTVRLSNTSLTVRRTSVVVNGVTHNTSAGDFSFTRLYRQHGNGLLYLDDYVVGDTRIGCGGQPPPPDTVPPTTPTNFAGNAATSTLTWTASTDSGGSGLSGYHIFRCTRNPGDCTPTVQTGTAPANATSFVDASAQAGFTYDYKVRAFDGAGNVSLFTAEVSLTIPTTNRRTLFSDTFIRADNADAGANWDDSYTSSFTLKISGNRLAPSTVANNNLETYNNGAGTIPADQWASVLIADGVSINENIFVLARTAAGPTWNGYECAVTNISNGGLRRRDAGVSTNLDSRTLSVPMQIGDRVRIEVQGTGLKCFLVRTNQTGQQSEELFGAASDSTYATGRVGIRVSANTLPSLRISEFLAGDFTNTVDSGITHDATSTSALANTATTLNWNHTIGVSDNRFLAVCLQTRNAGPAVTVPNVTANGIGLLKFRDDTRTTASSVNMHTSLWRFINPSPGTNAIQATFSAVPSSYAVGSSSSFFGVEQVAPVDAVGGANGTGTAVSLPVTSTVTNTLVIDCALGLDGFSAAGGGQTILRNNETTVGTDGVGSSTKPLAAAGAATTAWTQQSATDWVGSVIAIKPAQVNNIQRPKILTATVSPTGATLTYDTTTPTKVRVIHGQNDGENVQSVDIPIANIPGGVVSRIWSVGDEFARFIAMDQFGSPNTSSGEFISKDLTVVAPAANSNPVTMTNSLPTGELPAGTTSRDITMNVDQVQFLRECRFDTNDVAYASMPTANQMTVSGTFASGTMGGLTNGNSYTVYKTCIYLNEANELIESPARSSSTFSVATSTGDTTPPGNVTNVSFIASGTQADGTWSAATDAVIYDIFLASGSPCGTYALAATSVTTSATLMNLPQNQTYCVKVKARDAVGNPSAADSNISTFFVEPVTDSTPPGDLLGLNLVTFTSSVTALFQQGVDAVRTTIEYCAGAGCTPGDFSVTASGTAIGINGLTPGTLYRFTGYHTDSAGNNSLGRHPVVETTTNTVGLPADRPVLPFGTSRATGGSGVSAGTRAPRP
jgi:hypothetical protein